MRPLVLVSLIAVGCASKGLAVPGPLASVGTHVPVPAPEPASDPVAHAAEPPEEPPAEPTHRRAEQSELGRAVAEAAAYYLDHKPRGFRDDCSGFIGAVYDRAGMGLSGSTASLWNNAKDLGATHKRKIPAIGDLAFFDNTYDRDGNGKRDDALTHVAVVMHVDADGTILLAHAGTSKGRAELRMNLLEPSVYTDDEDVITNDYLRARYRTDPDGTPRLAGQLWRGFATISPDQIDAWAGG